MHQLVLHSDFKLIFIWGSKSGGAVNNRTGISPTKHGNTKHPLEQAAPVQARGSQAKAITSAVTEHTGVPSLVSLLSAQFCCLLEALILGLCKSLNAASLFLII